MLKSLSKQGLDLSSFCLSYRLSPGPRRLHDINFQKWVKALQTYKMSKRTWNSWNGLNFKTCHDDRAAVVEWLLVAVSEVPETDGWWLFQIVTGFADICWIVRIFRELCQYRAKYSASPAQYCHPLILQNSTPVFFKMHGGDNLDHYEPDSVKFNPHNLD